MILYAVHVYELPTRNAREFIAGFRERLCSLRNLPGWIHSDLLEQSYHSRLLSRFLSISFFTSPEAMLLAEGTIEMRAFLGWARDAATLCVDLGTFSFPPWPAFEEKVQTVGTGCIQE